MTVPGAGGMWAALWRAPGASWPDERLMSLVRQGDENGGVHYLCASAGLGLGLSGGVLSNRLMSGAYWIVSSEGSSGFRVYVRGNKI